MPGEVKSVATSTGWKRLVLPAALIVTIGPVLEVLSWDFLPSFRDLGLRHKTYSAGLLTSRGSFTLFENSK